MCDQDSNSGASSGARFWCQFWFQFWCQFWFRFLCRFWCDSGASSKSKKKRLSKISRLLSKLLRHHLPHSGLSYGQDGYVLVQDILGYQSFLDEEVALDELIDVVKQDRKQRYHPHQKGLDFPVDPELVLPELL